VAAEVSRLEDRCMMSADFQWKGLTWYKNYNFNLEGTGWFARGQQWYDGEKSIKVEANGIHMFLNRQSIGSPDGSIWTSSEVVSKKHLGFGTYLVSAHHQGGFNLLGNNPTVTFGAFLYQKDADPNDSYNPHHELDMIEASRFGTYDTGGWQGTETNAQFTLQDFTKPPGHGGLLAPHDNPNVHRFTLNDDPNITLEMKWDAAGAPVTFYVYYGKHTLADLPKKDLAYEWKTGTNLSPDGNRDQNLLIPPEGQQQMHFILYRQPPNGVNDPSVHDDEVTVTNFEYKPLKSRR
jgi:hypothetical protein